MEKYTIYRKFRFDDLLGPAIGSAFFSAIVSTVLYLLLTIVSLGSFTSYGLLFLGVWIIFMMREPHQKEIAVINKKGINFSYPSKGGPHLPWNKVALHEGNPPPCDLTGNDLFLDVEPPLYDELLRHKAFHNWMLCCKQDSTEFPPHHKFICLRSSVVSQPLEEIKRVIQSMQGKL